MAKWVSKNKVKQVVINPFFYFEFDHIPSNDEIKQEIQDFPAYVGIFIVLTSISGILFFINKNHKLILI